jgi:hypothetical protein
VRLVARWSAAVALSACGFAGAWWVCQAALRLSDGVSLGAAGAVVAMVVAVAGWWAGREKPSGESEASGDVRVSQRVRAGRDVNVAGRDQKIWYGRRDR